MYQINKNVNEEDVVTWEEREHSFVSRGGNKLFGAIVDFNIDLNNKQHEVVMDSVKIWNRIVKHYKDNYDHDSNKTSNIIVSIDGRNSIYKGVEKISIKIMSIIYGI